MKLRLRGEAKYLPNPYTAHGKCDHCQEGKLVLVCDSSDGEYGPIALCLDCINLVFSGITTKEQPDD